MSNRILPLDIQDIEGLDFTPATLDPIDRVPDLNIKDAQLLPIDAAVPKDKLLNMAPYLEAATGALDIAKQGIANAQIRDTSDYSNSFTDYGNQQYTGGFEAITGQRRNAYIQDAPTYSQIRGKSGAQQAMGVASGAATGASAGMAFGPWGAAIGGVVGALGAGLGNIFGNRKAKRRAKRLREEREAAIAANNYNYTLGMENANKDIGFAALSNISAFGGPLHTHGSDWNNGITIIGNGGTHEQNPLEGVPIGIAPDGEPNLVEEGEVIYNDYVFSNRIRVPDAIRQKYKLRGNKEMTFADAAKKAQKESEERPNDPISQRGLEDIMNSLMVEQETIRQKNEERRMKRQFGLGGCLVFSDGGNIYIKPSKRGTFTAAAEKRGLGVQEFASKVLANPENYSPAMRKKANFARNASKWKHADGGKAERRQMRNINLLRAMPIFGSGVNVLTDVAGITNTPDYTNADMIRRAVTPIRDVAPSRIGNYMAYTPLDRMFYANQLNSQAGATRRAIMNTAGGNRATLMSGLLGADYNAQTALGNMLRQADEENFKRYATVSEFNRGTNQYNSEADLKAQMANATSDKARSTLNLDAAYKAANMRNLIDTAASQNRSTNMTNFLENLGDLGRERLAMKMVNDSPALLYDWVNNYKEKKADYLTMERRRHAQL